MTLKADLDKLASSLAQKAAMDDTTLAEATDALKALTSLYAVITKGGKKGSEPPEDGDTFEDFASQIGEESPNGRKTRVRGRSGHA